jgi:hypothetical protein
LRAAVPAGVDASGYATVWGTQYAAALVAAAAALVWTERPGLDAGQVAELLRATARDVGPPGRDADTGFGILDVAAALAGTAPPRDSDEPNDDVDQVAATGSFAGAKPAPALTTQHAPSGHVSGSLDNSEDPADLYRIWVPAHRTVRVAATAYGNAAARIWGPHTKSLHEGLAARRRDSKGTSIRAGSAGFRAWVEVLLTGRRRQTGYTLRVTASRR